MDNVYSKEYDVAPGHEDLYNQQMVIRLGTEESHILIHNLIKSRKEIEEAVTATNLILVKEKEISNPASVVDDSDPNKEYIVKHPMLMVLRK